MNKSEKLKQIHMKRLEQLDIIWEAQEMLKELNTQQQNLIMSVDGEVKEAEDNIEADQ